VTELERSLVALGRGLDLPATPDLVTAVLARIEQRAEPTRTQRRLVLAIAVGALALLGATLAIPDARSALFRILTVGGERIELVDELPEVEPVEDLELTLGEPVSLEEARDRADFDLRELEEEPDRAYLGERGSVWFLYGSLAAPRLLLAQTPLLRVDAPALLKKLAGEGTQVEEVNVNGSTGVFLSGAPHFVFLVDENGMALGDSARLAKDVLVWSEEGVSYRLEGDLGRERALELARELR
jgi:hypothetical protein